MSEFKWKSSFSEDIFRSKYSEGANDSWPNLCRRLVNDVCGDRSLSAKPNETPLLCKGDQEQLTQYMIDMSFIPAGRYLYYAGKPASFFNNCFSGDTKFLTQLGVKTLKECVGNTVNILSPISGEFTKASVKSYGYQVFNKIEFSNIRSSQHTTNVIKATPNHRWILLNGEITTTLKVGDIVRTAKALDIPYDNNAFIHGAVFADGNVHYKKKGFGHQLRLCGAKNKYVDIFEDTQISYPDFAHGDACVYIRSDFNLKELPNTNDINYIVNFIRGWISFDGMWGRYVYTTSKDAIDYFMTYAAYAGYVLTGELKCNVKPSNFGERKPLYSICFADTDTFIGLKVKSITPLLGYTETAYCVEEPIYNAFTLENNIATGNCLAMCAEEDTREEWARLAHNATLSLMTGAGIGINYDILRPEGYVIKKTGGTSSGPIPLMKIINEVGRNVMQGGSRRSALYASLNWQHEDIEKFLCVKDWDDHTKKHKAKDFNWHAPLDMTNISINWDTSFITSIGDYVDGVCVREFKNSVPQLWYDSVLKMCQNGEPGHSYNFWENEEDKLRNACAELSSRYDSDICNLGSINIANIKSLEHLKDVVNLASKFLVCGTMRADVPYEKVSKVRSEHRKIGLGLMGVHEWLLQRGYKYEVVDELKEWLSVWKEESERSAIEHCNRFYISIPEKFRAIAPAGTISILASSSSGIEPLYAVAYKRRYLDEGTKWKYRYVIDSTAERIIKEYGVVPESIETSSSLASEPETRIRFQYEIQKYVDMAISSTINLPSWNSEFNNENTSTELANTLLKYCHGLRGITVYPNGSRGGQPLTSVEYDEAKKHHGIVFAEENTCAGGICGI